MASNRLEDDEPPLDPVLLRVQARLRRLMLIGGLTLGVGIAAVFIAIVYRFFIMASTGEPARPAQMVAADVTAASLGLTAAADLVGVSLDGNRLALVFREGGDTVTVLLDAATMTVLGRFRIAAE
jgi:hypothetical protein